MSSTCALISTGVSAHSTVAPRAVAFFSKISSQTSRSSRARWRIARPASRVPSKSSSSTIDSRRLATNLPLIFCRLPWSCAFAMLACARSLKCIEAISMSARRSGQDLGDVQHARLHVPTAAQPSLDVEHAAAIAQHDCVCGTARDVTALVISDPRRNLAKLDRERTAEAAAGLAFGHLDEFDTRNLREQRARLPLDAHLAQSRAGIVVGHRSGERARHAIEL